MTQMGGWKLLFGGNHFNLLPETSQYLELAQLALNLKSLKLEEQENEILLQCQTESIL